MRSIPLPRGAALLLAPLALLAGCASLSDDGGLAGVRSLTAAHLPQELPAAHSAQAPGAADARVAALLAKPLAVDDAVQLALLNNRGLQADFALLRIAETDLVAAGRLPNPGFSFGRATRGDTLEIERGLHFDLGRLIALPLLREVESRRFAQAQSDAAQRALGLAGETRQAWFQAVAARETARYMQQVAQAAQASAELARRMAEVGNFSALQRAREERFQAEAALAVVGAQRAEQASRERLVRLLGLWGDDAARLALPERLPELPAAPRELPEVERIAIAQRLDVQSARLAAEQSAKNLGLTRATRFVNVLELGVQRNSESGEPVQRGWEIGFELPIFDGGGTRTARAQAAYMHSVHRAADLAIRARSEVREAYGAYRSAWDIARRHRDELVPLARRIGDENLLRYNGMLIGVFELLADARAQIGAVSASIAAQRDFWLAQSALDMALIGKPVAAPVEGAPPAAAAAGGEAH